MLSMHSTARPVETKWFWIAAIWGGIGLLDASQTVFVMRAEGMQHYWGRLYFTTFISWLPWALATPLVLHLAHRCPLVEPPSTGPVLKSLSS